MQNDKLDLLKSGSLQHLGENMLAFLLRIASSPHLPKSKDMDRELKTGHDTAIFFDILVRYNYFFNTFLGFALRWLLSEFGNLILKSATFLSDI